MVASEARLAGRIGKGGVAENRSSDLGKIGRLVAGGDPGDQKKNKNPGKHSDGVEVKNFTSWCRNAFGSRA